MTMRFTIVTPSFRSSRWLSLCLASVADQDFEHEHIIQDSCSDDGTQDWLPHDQRVTAIIEKDRGMYDAVNRGWRRAQGDWVAYLNCDEQYLPGTLRRVNDFLAQNPGVDVVFGDTVVVDDQGDYICDRTSLVPQVPHSFVSGTLSFLTASLFLRRQALLEHDLFFNPTMLALGDAEWTIRLVRSGLKMALLGAFTSIFTETGGNLSQRADSLQEKAEFIGTAPSWMRRLARLIVLHFRLRRAWHGAYFCPPYSYAIYTQANPAQRRVFEVKNPTYRWIR